MNYIALARKWRPRTFSQLIGQEHVTKALINSITKNRLHHAYLFTGTRGVGKTSIARIFAKALSCLRGVSAEPCLECEACIAIEKNHFMDLIEIDGASRTRVEDTRELLENVQYLPTIGRFKIYLIDEVHMLSQHSFNAILKTLEEPPEHVKFFLATTDPQKLPVTVLSRCLQFNLKPVNEDTIQKHLAKILQDEKIEYEVEALSLISKAARGSIRDALSLLDQSIALSTEQLLAQHIKDLLGYTKQDYAIQLLNALAQFDPNQLIQLSKQIGSEGAYYEYVLDEILNYLHQININQQVSISDTHRTPELIALSKAFSPEDVQLFYEIGIRSREELHLAPTIAIGFEMMLLRMYTFRPAPSSPQPLLYCDTANKNEAKSVDNLMPDKAHAELTADNSLQEEAAHRTAVYTSIHEDSSTVSTKQGVSAVALGKRSEEWSSIIQQLKLTGLAATAIEHSEFIDKNQSLITLCVNKSHLSMFTPNIIKRIEQALSNYYQENIKLMINHEKIADSPAQQRQDKQQKLHEEAATTLQNDSFFQELQQTFSAELVKNSVVSKKR